MWLASRLKVQLDKLEIEAEKTIFLETAAKLLVWLAEKMQLEAICATPPANLDVLRGFVETLEVICERVNIGLGQIQSSGVRVVASAWCAANFPTQISFYFITTICIIIVHFLIFLPFYLQKLLVSMFCTLMLIYGCIAVTSVDQIFIQVVKQSPCSIKAELRFSHFAS